jgi:hypothetical protein
MENLPPIDQEPIAIGKEQKQHFQLTIQDKTVRHGNERVDHDGYTVTFMLDSVTTLTCRYITKPGEEFRTGWYAELSQTLHEDETGAYTQHSRVYSLPKWRKPATVEDFYTDYDEDGEEVEYKLTRPEGMPPQVWKNERRKQKRIIDNFSGRAFGGPFSLVDYEDIMGLLIAVNEAHVVSPEDAIAED